MRQSPIALGMLNDPASNRWYTARTVHFGKPTEEQKRAFTRVLQGQ